MSFFMRGYDNLDIFKFLSRGQAYTHPAFWPAARVRRTSVFAAGENLGAGAALPPRALKSQRVEAASGGQNPKRKT